MQSSIEISFICKFVFRSVFIVIDGKTRKYSELVFIQLFVPYCSFRFCSFAVCITRMQTKKSISEIETKIVFFFILKWRQRLHDRKLSSFYLQRKHLPFSIVPPNGFTCIQPIRFSMKIKWSKIRIFSKFCCNLFLFSSWIPFTLNRLFAQFSSICIEFNTRHYKHIDMQLNQFTLTLDKRWYQHANTENNRKKSNGRKRKANEKSRLDSFQLFASIVFD